MTEELKGIWLRVAMMLVVGYVVCVASAGVFNPFEWDAIVKLVLLAWSLFWLYVGYDMSCIVMGLDDDSEGEL